jgi:hypothetical protein
MITKYYVDLKGNYIGGFSGLIPNKGIEVSAPPKHGLDIWNGKSFDSPKPTQLSINNKSLDYLKSTDWYILRMSETSVSVPDKVLKARAAARYAIKEV